MKVSSINQVVVLLSLMQVSRQEAVQTAQGSIEGVSNDGYTSYFGIPYASVREKNGRFKKAGLARFWTGTLKHQGVRTSCPTASSEDCLGLDVHVPAGATGTSLPVLVWVQGGNSQYHPGKLVTKGIIFVNVIYRSGPFGFLCLGHEMIPGNIGAKDVVLALRWVRDNIVAFKGSPDNVVVAGQSFGGAIVDALLLSPSAQGLFHGAIIQSGSILSPWGFNYDAEDRARVLARLYTDSEDMATMVSALTNAKVESLIDKTKTLDLPYFPFAMCEEKPFKKEELFLSDKPIQLLRDKLTNKVPLMIGFNSNEAYIFAENLENANFLNRVERDSTLLLPEELVFFSEKENKQTIKRIRKMYFTGNHTMDALLGYHRDAYFLNHIHRSARLHALSHDLPVYYYQFDYTGEVGVDAGEIRKAGAAHSDELAYLFPDRDRRYDEEDGVVQEIMLALWSNFVKYLNPTPSTKAWERLDPHNPRLYSISTSPEMRDFPHTKAMQFWDDVYEKHYYSRQEHDE